MDIILPKVGERIEYRVLRNPVSAPKRDYVAEAMVIAVHDGGLLDVVVVPRRSEPFQIGPLPHRSLRQDNILRIEVWDHLKAEQE